MTANVQLAVRAVRKLACWLLPVVTAAAVLFVASRARADTVELLSGIRINGKITSKTATSVTVQSTIGSRTIRRSIPVGKIHAVTIGTKRQVLNEKPDAEPSGGTSPDTDPPSGGTGATGAAPGTSGGTAAGLVGGLAMAGASLDDPAAFRPVRPPGSIPEEQFLQMCIRCGECFQATRILVASSSGGNMDLE